MSKARDLLNKTGGSGGLFPKPVVGKPIVAAKPDQGPDHPSGKPSPADMKSKGKPTKSGLGSAPTSVRPKV